MTNPGNWQFWIDRGGTFTDVVARTPEGQLLTLKLLSDNPGQYTDAALAGIDMLLQKNAAAHHDPARIQAVKMGTTVATNALLERQGEPTLLVISRGFADLLRIGYQNRPHLFDKHIQLPSLLYQQVIEADERISADGAVLQPLNVAALRAQLQQHYDAGLRSVAIALLHGYRYPLHELQVADLAEQVGFTQISVSHQVNPLIKLVSRGDTTVVDAYLSPILRRYIDRVSGALDQNTRLQFMQSSGGLTDAHHFRGKDAILSGPAGGVVSMVQTALDDGFEQIIGFDMGGTSTDVSLFHGEYERAFETQVAGVRLRAPMMKIHTVAAGGGSILDYDGRRFTVGPASAGAQPGPVCYRNNGPLAVTDINVLLGKIQPDFFPSLFGNTGDQPLDKALVESHFGSLREQILQQQGIDKSVEEIGSGYLQIAVAHMANAIKQISTLRGHDIKCFTLSCFGGAGPQHACLVADALGIETIFIHQLSGVLSAYGMGLAKITATRQRSLEEKLDRAGLIQAEQKLAELTSQASSELLQQGYAQERQQHKRWLHLRYQGSDTSLAVQVSTLTAMQQTFEQEHLKIYGFTVSDAELVIATLEVEASVAEFTPASSASSDSIDPLTPQSSPPATESRPVYFAGQWRDTPFYRREQLQPGDSLQGPAIVVEADTTVVVEPDWQLMINQANNLVLTRCAPTTTITDPAAQTRVDPVMLEIFNNLFMHIAEQMGIALSNTASSVNIKERLDFSCAVFDPAGGLVANAPHMPVHLGSMGESVRAVITASPGMAPGDVYMLNSPYAGGTHLPDITVVTPIFDDVSDDIGDDIGEDTGASSSEDTCNAKHGRDPRLLFFVASRGHHADIGGTNPGSMPPHSTHIDEEGVLFECFKLVDRGELQQQALLTRLSSGRYPARNPEQNLADLKAQIAANQKGVLELNKVITHFTLPVVHAYMQHIQDYAEACVRRAIRALSDGQFCYPLDDGSQIQVQIRVDKDKGEAQVDFSGTSAQQHSNFNAPAAVCRAAVLYVFRTLVEENIPLNEGCLIPIQLHIPPGSMLNPAWPAAVVAGNVETSQCITDALYGALKVMAASQGTMNNLTFGNQNYQYYETICGGSGAGPAWHGTSAVHTHMTNSRLTDPEVLELRYPVRVERFEIRRGSGGGGQFRGGDGVIRAIRAVAPMQAAILSNHRRQAPFGVVGGEAAATGKNYLLRADGTRESLDSCAQVDLGAGDQIVIETPGGGGYGYSRIG